MGFFRRAAEQSQVAVEVAASAPATAAGAVVRREADPPATAASVPPFGDMYELTRTNLSISGQCAQVCFTTRPGFGGPFVVSHMLLIDILARRARSWRIVGKRTDGERVLLDQGPPSTFSTVDGAWARWHWLQLHMPSLLVEIDAEIVFEPKTNVKVLFKSNDLPFFGTPTLGNIRSGLRAINGKVDSLVIKSVALMYGDGAVDVMALPEEPELAEHPAGLLAPNEFVSRVRWWRAQTKAESYASAMDFLISRRDGKLRAGHGLFDLESWSWRRDGAGQLSSRSFELFGKRLNGKAPTAPCCKFVAPAGEEIVVLRFERAGSINCLKSVFTLRTARAGGGARAPPRLRILKRTLPEVVAVSTEFGTAWYAHVPDMRLSSRSATTPEPAVEVPPPFGRPHRPHVHYWLIKPPTGAEPGTLVNFKYSSPAAPAAHADAAQAGPPFKLPLPQRKSSMIVPENAPKHAKGTLFVVPIDERVVDYAEAKAWSYKVRKIISGTSLCGCFCALNIIGPILYAYLYWLSGRGPAWLYWLWGTILASKLSMSMILLCNMCGICRGRRIEAIWSVVLSTLVTPLPRLDGDDGPQANDPEAQAATRAGACAFAYPFFAPAGLYDSGHAGLDVGGGNWDG
jgi:hypothetical protein